MRNAKDARAEAPLSYLGRDLKEGDLVIIQ